MPLTLDIDWDHAHQLYNQGLKVPKIAEKLGVKAGTISGHAKRHKWAQRRLKASQAVSEVVQSLVLSHPKVIKTVQKRAEEWIDRTANDVERTVSVLEKLPVPDDLDGIRKHEEVWGMHVKRGRSTFGLDNQGQSITLNVGLVSRGDIMPVEQVIDVEPEPVASTITST